MATRKFQKEFIELKENNPNYRLSQKNPLGYCKMEVRQDRVKFYVYIQNLKPLKESVYKVYIIGLDQGDAKIIYSDHLEIGSNGKGELQVFLNPDNLADSGLTVEQIQGIAVAVQSQPNAPVEVVLEGFLDRPVYWVSKAAVMTPEQPKIEEKPEIEAQMEETNIIETAPQQEELVEEEETVEQSIEQEGVEEPPPIEMNGSEAEEQEEMELEEELIEDLTGEVIEGPDTQLLQRLIEQRSVHMELYTGKPVYWVAIEPDEAAKVISKWEIYEPYVIPAYDEHKHLVLGIEVENYAVRKYYLAVPGAFHPTQQEQYRHLCCKGFYNVYNPFFPVDNLGYWILELLFE